MTQFEIASLAGVGGATRLPAERAARHPGPAESATGGASFETLLAANSVRLSSHAQKRLAARDIRLDAPEAKRLAEAVDRAQQKGSQDSLILMDDLAFIVDVQRRTIVTAVDSNNQKEGVFTNIDSVVLAK